MGVWLWGGHELPKVLPFYAPETALWLFHGWPTHWADNLRLSSTLLDTPHCTPVKVIRPSNLMFGLMPLEARSAIKKLWSEMCSFLRKNKITEKQVQCQLGFCSCPVGGHPLPD
jgi:hypothetical protein